MNECQFSLSNGQLVLEGCKDQELQSLSKPNKVYSGNFEASFEDTVITIKQTGTDVVKKVLYAPAKIGNIYLSPTRNYLAVLIEYGTPGADRFYLYSLDDYSRKIFTAYTELSSFSNLYFSPDGKYIAATGHHHPSKWMDGYASYIWDIETQKIIQVLKINEEPYEAWRGEENYQHLAFSPDSQSVAYIDAAMDNYLRVISIQDGSELAVYKDLKGKYNVAISPDNQIIATLNYDQIIQLWNLSDGSFISEYELDLRKGAFYGTSKMPFSNDSNYLYAFDKIIDIRGNRSIDLDGYDFVSFSLNQDEGIFLKDSNFMVINLLDFSIVKKIPFQNINAINDFSQDGRYFVALNPGGLIRLWDMSKCWDAENTNNCYQLVNQFSTYLEYAKSIKFSIDSNKILAEWRYRAIFFDTNDLKMGNYVGLGDQWLSSWNNANNFFLTTKWEKVSLPNGYITHQFLYIYLTDDPVWISGGGPDHIYKAEFRGGALDGPIISDDTTIIAVPVEGAVVLYGIP